MMDLFKLEPSNYLSSTGKIMPRRNPRGEEVSKGWKGMRGRKARENLYHVRIDGITGGYSSIKPGDLIEVLVRSVNRRGEGDGIYEGRQVIIAGAPDPGVTVRARIRKIVDGKIFAEIVDDR